MNEGSVIEGIFAMYCALILIDPNDGGDFNKIRNAIDDMRLQTTVKNLATRTSSGRQAQAVKLNKVYPKDDEFSSLGTTVVTGRQVMTSGNNTRINPSTKYFENPGRNGSSYPDYTMVHLDVTLKEQEAGAAYGRRVAQAISEFREGNPRQEFRSLRRKIDVLIRQQGSNFFRKLVGAKEKFLKNNQTDVVLYKVIADGIGGETSGGAIKQDITIRVIANGRRIFDDEINFSLKSDATTIENQGLYRGIIEVYDVFKDFYGSQRQTADGLKSLIEDTYEGRVDGVKKKTVHKEAVAALWQLTTESIPSNGTPLDKTDYWYDTLSSAAFGTQFRGSISVVNVGATGFHELTQEYVRMLRTSGNGNGGPLRLQAKHFSRYQDDIRIMPEGENDAEKCIFKIRLKYERSARRLEDMKKIMIELGGKNSVIHEENFNTYLQSIR